MISILEILTEHALVIDFGMLLVIWIVQIIIYPSLSIIEDSGFSDWHRRYCSKIGFFVLPLMTAQFLESSGAVFFVGSILDWCKFVTVILALLVTFAISAPCHRKLTKLGRNHAVLDRLSATNWFRTVLWSSAFILSFIKY